MSKLQQPSSDDSNLAYSEPPTMLSSDEMAEGFLEKLAADYKEPERVYNLNAYDYPTIYKYKIGKPGPCPPAFVKWATKRGIRIPDIVEHNEGFMTFQSGLGQILKRYATRKAWKEESIKDKNSYDAHYEDISIEREASVDLVERYRATYEDRERRIMNNDEEITEAIVENQKQWQKYIVRVIEAERRTPTGLNWIPFLKEEWKKREDLFPKFWDMLEKEELEKEKDMDFLQGKLEELIRDAEAFFEIPPAWIE